MHFWPVYASDQRIRRSRQRSRVVVSGQGPGCSERAPFEGCEDAQRVQVVASLDDLAVLDGRDGDVPVKAPAPDDGIEEFIFVLGA
jgi:hypothetical protein